VGTNMKVQAIIAAGGIGERMCQSRPKPMLSLGDEPVFIRTLKIFEACALIDSCVMVVPEEYRAAYRSLLVNAGINKLKMLVAGGATRTQSVRCALRVLDQDTEMVVVHDAVRPFVTEVMIGAGVAAAQQYRAAVAAVPVKPTIKVVSPESGFIVSNLDRALLWEIQTPQVFERQILEKAYAADEDATDDAGLVERMGVAVKVYAGSYQNIKLTTPEDMIVAEAFLREMGN
jgi:2-C-methyl-D-erythritol 4-phosphate cytidylyltransferase